MATLGGPQTYIDLATTLGPDHKVAVIIELLKKTNRILDDMIVKEGNLPTGHKTIIRTGLPTATWRLLNYGVQPTKGITSSITDTIGNLEAYAEVDKDIADLNGNTAKYRLSQATAHMEAMNQQMATALFYGNQSADPRQFTGLMPRYPNFGATNPAITAYNCIAAHAGADAVQTSMWLIVWGENAVHGIFPKGAEAGGLQHKDMGEVTLDDDQTPPGHYQGYRDHFKWQLGLTVADWRYAVRICNIDTVLMTASVVDLFTAMTKAYYRIPSFGMGKAVFYANNLVLEFLQIQAAAKSNAALKYEEVGGRPITRYLGIPIEKCDALLNTEALVTTV